MIVTRSPLRISLGGGGTDLPSYYKNHEGFLIAAAIDKYVYITLHETFNEEIIIKYSELEKRKSIEDIKHPIIRECLKLLNYKKLSIEISSMADIPAGTGLRKYDDILVGSKDSYNELMDISLGDEELNTN